VTVRFAHQRNYVWKGSPRYVMGTVSCIWTENGIITRFSDFSGACPIQKVSYVIALSYKCVQKHPPSIDSITRIMILHFWLPCSNYPTSPPVTTCHYKHRRGNVSSHHHYFHINSHLITNHTSTLHHLCNLLAAPSLPLTHHLICRIPFRFFLSFSPCINQCSIWHFTVRTRLSENPPVREPYIL